MFYLKGYEGIKESSEAWFSLLADLGVDIHLGWHQETVVEQGYLSPYRFATKLREIAGDEFCDVYRIGSVYVAIGNNSVAFRRTGAADVIQLDPKQGIPIDAVAV